ncbi:MAG: DUF169 domain-containing protein [Candidatus Aminicenantes bacterium]|nr:DUF169 domain-containing protein [Candidatus Aminicenantes bacterium]
MKERQPLAEKLLKRIDLDTSLIGFYDAPASRPFEPLIKPNPGDCVFSFYQNWLRGETLHITKDHYGCGGAGYWMCGIESRPREEFLRFLVEGEGLKASEELMEKWIDASKPYRAKHPHLFVGPLKPDQWEYVKSVTFFVNPDQLSILMLGAHYHNAPGDPPAVIAPFGSGCMELLPFENPDIPQAAIGATDIAMRHHLSPDTLALTVTKPLFMLLCGLDEQSFLYKPFLQRLRKARGFPSG